MSILLTMYCFFTFFASISIIYHTRARMFTRLLSGVMAMSPFGLVVAGPVADIGGVQIWFIIAGIPIIIMGVISFFIPSIIHIEAPRQDN